MVGRISLSLSDIRELYPEGNMVELNKSYRSIYEIIMFAKEIQQSVHMEPLERHGDIPLIMSCRDRQDEVLKIKEKLDVFLISDYEIQLISPDSTRFINGISVTSIQMSKGLEFDQVVIVDGDDQTIIKRCT